MQKIEQQQTHNSTNKQYQKWSKIHYQQTKTSNHNENKSKYIKTYFATEQAIAIQKQTNMRRANIKHKTQKKQQANITLK